MFGRTRTPSAKVQQPMGPGLTSTKTVAVGFHATWRDPKTVAMHKGTKPTIERHDKEGDPAAIKSYLKTTLGIEEWHPLWFGGDISKRPFPVPQRTRGQRARYHDLGRQGRP
jgi:hypothetical protein